VISPFARRAAGWCRTATDSHCSVPPTRVHAALGRYSYHFRLVESVFESPAYRWVPWRAWPEF